MEIRIDETIEFGIKLKGRVEIEHVDAEPDVGVTGGTMIVGCHISIRMPDAGDEESWDREEIRGLRFYKGRLRIKEIYCLDSGKPWKVTDVEWT